MAEDGKTNQKLAVSLFQKWGHQVLVAENGSEAVNIWREGGFDPILMDLQMPVMDGLEATERIRQEEKELVGAHIPIIAITAHAMKGDRETCFDGGMDGYVTRPIRQPDRYDAISDFFLGDDFQRSGPADSKVRPAIGLGIIDWPHALGVVGGDTDLPKEIVKASLSEIGKRFSDFESALSLGDLDEARRQAHSISATGRTFGAKALIEQTRVIQVSAKEGDSDFVIRALPNSSWKSSKL